VRIKFGGATFLLIPLEAGHYSAASFRPARPSRICRLTHSVLRASSHVADLLIFVRRIGRKVGFQLELALRGSGSQRAGIIPITEMKGANLGTPILEDKKSSLYAGRLAIINELSQEERVSRLQLTGETFYIGGPCPKNQN
jgi:hypothetical protein